VTNGVILEPASAVCGTWTEALALWNSDGTSNRTTSPAAPATPPAFSRSLREIRSFQLIAVASLVHLADVSKFAPGDTGDGLFYRSRKEHRL
jgi:hypothetical protein